LDGTSFDKEVIIKTLISNKSPREFFEQIIFVESDDSTNMIMMMMECK